MSSAQPFAARWLARVRTHPARTRQAWSSAHALAPYMDDRTGEAQVTLETMHRDSRLAPKTLRTGFEHLEAMELLARHARRKPSSMEWDVTLYRPRVNTTRGPVGQNDPNTSNEFGTEYGSKRPTGRDTCRSKRPTGTRDVATCGSCGDELGDNWEDCDECYAHES